MSVSTGATLAVEHPTGSEVLDCDVVVVDGCVASTALRHDLNRYLAHDR